MRSPGTVTSSAIRPTWLLVAGASAGAAAIHLAYGPGHLEELGVLGLGFFIAGALQLGWAAVAACLAVWRPTPAAPASLVWAGIAINVAILAAWAVSRTLGLPAGAAPWTPQAIGLPDAIAAALEGGLVLAITASFRGEPRLRLRTSRGALGMAAAILALSLISTGTVVAVSGAGTHAHGPGEGHAHPAEPADVLDTEVVEMPDSAADGEPAPPGSDAPRVDGQPTDPASEPAAASEPTPAFEPMPSPPPVDDHHEGETTPHAH